jgi:hypothetical protein
VPKTTKIAILGLLMMAACHRALAQTPPGFNPISYATPISVSTVSASSALFPGWSVVVYNTGANVAFVNFGTSSTITATTAQNAIPAGGGCGFYVFPNTWIAAITATSTTTLNVASGNGKVPECW